MEVAIRVRSDDDVHLISVGSVHFLAVDVVLVLGVLHHSLGLVTRDVVLALFISE